MQVTHITVILTEEMLKDGCLKRLGWVELHNVPLFGKGGRALRLSDREQVIETCRKAQTSRIIVIHELEKMFKMAEMVKDSKIIRRRIVVIARREDLHMAIDVAARANPGLYVLAASDPIEQPYLKGGKRAKPAAVPAA